MDYYLGIDPSTRSTGWSIVTSSHKLVDYGLIKPSLKLDPIEKLSYQRDILSEILLKYDIQCIGCEEQFFGRNVKTMKKLVQVSTMVIMLSVEYNIPIKMYYPEQWRKVFHGQARGIGKDETIALANEVFYTSFTHKDNDMTDSIGIAYATMMEAEADGNS